MDLKEYRTGLYHALWTRQIPDRVPIAQGVDIVYALQYGGYSLLRDQYSAEKCYEAVDNITALIDSDVAPVGFSANGVPAIISGSKINVMGKDGFWQHPNYAPMKDTEYPEFINNFAEFNNLVDMRLNSAYENAKDEEELAITKLRVQVATQRHFKKTASIAARINEKYQFATHERSLGTTLSPFDNLSNRYRSFTGALNDIRRRPEEVLAAVRLICDNNLRRLDTMPEPQEGQRIFMPLHLATFMKESDFKKFWWPFFKEFVDKAASQNRRLFIFCEDRWDRYMDYLEEVPEDAHIMFEYTDPRLAKERLGKNHVLSGFFSVDILKNATKEKCADEVKKLLDIVAPGGGYIFKSDKGPLILGDAKLENIQTAIATVKEYGKY